MQVMFADGIVKLFVSQNGLVHVEFGVSNPSQSGTEHDSVSPTLQIVLPIEGFLKTFSAQEDLVKSMIKDGLVKRQDGQSKFSMQ